MPTRWANVEAPFDHARGFVSSKLSRLFPVEKDPSRISCSWPCGLSPPVEISIIDSKDFIFWSIIGPVTLQPSHTMISAVISAIAFTLDISSFSSFFQIPKLSVLTVYEAKSRRVFSSDLWWLVRFPFEEQQKVCWTYGSAVIFPSQKRNQINTKNWWK